MTTNLENDVDIEIHKDDKNTILTILENTKFYNIPYDDKIKYLLTEKKILESRLNIINNILNNCQK